MLPVVKNAPFVLAGVRDVVQVSQLTGPSSPNKTGRFEVAGQDLGSMFEAGGETWFVFGDTFGTRTPGMTGGSRLVHGDRDQNGLFRPPGRSSHAAVPVGRVIGWP